MKPVISTIVFAGALILGSNTTIAQYKQKNLVADEKGHAIRTDTHLINGWGLAFFPHGPFWVGDEGTGVSTLYGPHGKIIPLVVTIPAAPSQPLGAQGTPTGLVANATSDFVISQNGKSGPALFIFDSEDGTISGWNPDVDSNNAVIVIDYSTSKPKRRFPASYYGLAIGRNSRGQDVIYAADGGASVDTDNNEIDMFDDEFDYLGSFSDPQVPSDMGVYGIQNIDGKLYVSFAGFQPHQGGIIDVFDTDGKLLRRFAQTLRKVRFKRRGVSPSRRLILGYSAMLFWLAMSKVDESMPSTRIQARFSAICEMSAGAPSRSMASGH
jgi:uncharacterized protein (TIGR03118 family)